MTQSPGITHLPIQKIQDAGALAAIDELAIEEPLEIRLQHGPAADRREQSVSITMRTPGNDIELATGFLFTEGIIPDGSAIDMISTFTSNSILVSLKTTIPLDLGRLQRHFYTTSSCGVCGKSSLEALRTVCPTPQSPVDLYLSPDMIYSMPEKLRRQQDIFGSTGGLHAAALFDIEGNILSLKEDIGRHNALDKLIGANLQDNTLPLNNHVLLLSGRACFELIQKAAMAGIQVVAAVGAPSSLAVELAQECNMTLIGFLRDQRFNIYTESHRVRI